MRGLWILICIYLGLIGMVNVQAEEEPQRVRPYVLAAVGSGELEQQQQEVAERLQQGGFELLGSYRPYDGAVIHLVTNEQLKREAAGSEHGGFGAALRVAITEVNDQLQVSYTNPVWMAHVYRMQDDLGEWQGSWPLHWGSSASSVHPVGAR